MVKIGNDINTIEFQAQNSSILSNHSIIYRFFKKNERLVINSQNADIKHNNLNILHHNHITTPHIRNKIYKGTTELIIVDGDKNIFTIPDEMYLTNNTNGQNNYISTQELHGTFSHEIESNLPFAVNDDDLFISGDNLFFLQQDNYLKITKNSHLIYTKQPADMQKNKQNKPVVYDIKSEKMQPSTTIDEKNMAEESNQSLRHFCIFLLCLFFCFCYHFRKLRWLAIVKHSCAVYTTGKYATPKH